MDSVLSDSSTGTSGGRGDPESRADLWWRCGADSAEECAFLRAPEDGPVPLVRTPSSCPVCKGVAIAVHPSRELTGGWSCAVASSEGSTIIDIDGFAGAEEAWIRALAFARAYLWALRFEV